MSGDNRKIGKPCFRQVDIHSFRIFATGKFLIKPANMKIFKFGGASINSTERIANVSKIIASYKGEKILVIISAMGKVTNALEKVAEEFFKGNKEQAER